MQLNSALTLHDAQALAANLPALMIEVERVASTIVQGIHGRRRKGTGEAFWEYRRFAHEDPAYRIDWRQSAKSDALYVRENEWEASQACWMWIDASASMNYRSGAAHVSKFERALVLGLACASLLLQGGERVGDLRSSEPPRHGSHALEHLAERFLAPHASHQGPSNQGPSKRSSRRSTTSLPPHTDVSAYCDVVLISDFFTDMDELTRRFHEYANRHYRLHVLQVIDPAEEDLPFEGRTRFVGMEENLTFIAGDTAKLRSAYQEKLHMHRDYLRSLCGSYGWSFDSHRTDHSPNTALLSLYLSLSGGDQRTLSLVGGA